MDLQDGHQYTSTNPKIDNFFQGSHEEEFQQWKRDYDEAKTRETEENRFNFEDYQRYLGDLGRANLLESQKQQQLKRIELMMDKQKQRDQKVHKLAMI